MMLVGGCFLHAQEQVAHEDGPRATVVYKTPIPQKSALMLQIEELADYDQVLVEQFFYHLNKNGKNITKISNEVSNSNEGRREAVAGEMTLVEVKAILTNLKSKSHE